MSLLISFIKALPFLLPFIKEVFVSNNESRSKYCVRVYLLGLLSLIAAFIGGQQVYNLHLEQTTKIVQMTSRIEELTKISEEAKRQADDFRVRNQRMHADYSALSQRYNSLHEDFKDIRSSYDILVRRTVERNGKYTKEDLEDILDEAREIKKKTKLPSEYKLPDSLADDPNR